MTYDQETLVLEPDTVAAVAEEKARSAEKTRVQFDLPPRSMKILIELKDKTDAASYAEVFKNALKLYDGIISEAEKGKQFLVRDASGNMTEFKMFL
jgi:hypothetical protein